LPYLNNSDQYKALAAFGNAKQILMQFLVKEESKRRTEVRFKPFKPLIQHENLEAEIQQLIAANKIEIAEQKSVELSNLCLDGLRYYQTYDWLFLRSIISIGYLGWIAYSLVFVWKTYCEIEQPGNKKGGKPIAKNNYETYVSIHDQIGFIDWLM
jgi:phosphatidylinositol glycan class N